MRQADRAAHHHRPPVQLATVLASLLAAACAMGPQLMPLQIVSSLALDRPIRLDFVAPPKESEAAIAALGNSEWFAEASALKMSHPDIAVISLELAPGQTLSDLSKQVSDAMDGGRSLYLFTDISGTSQSKPTRLDTRRPTTITLDAGGVRID
jgi:hypothetical protein